MNTTLNIFAIFWLIANVTATNETLDEVQTTMYAKPVSHVQETQALSWGKAFKEWSEKKQEAWLQIHDNYQDKLKVFVPFFAAEAFALRNVASLSVTQLTSGAIGGYLLADLLSGIVHCVLDNISSKDFLSMPFKDMSSLSALEEIALTAQGHHPFPKQITKSSYWYSTWDSYILMLPILAAGGALAYYGYDTNAYMLGVAALLVPQANYTHALAHGKNSGNRFVRFLQKTGLIISRKNHNIHHRNTDLNYCSLSGHMNWLLNPVAAATRNTYRFFRKWCGARPVREIASAL